MSCPAKKMTIFTYIRATQRACHFSREYRTGSINLSTTVHPPAFLSPLTHLVCVWPSLSLHSRVRVSCPAKKITSFIAKHASHCYPFHPPGLLKLLGLAWNHLAATTLGFLPQSSLTRNPLGFEAHWLPAMACSQENKFLFHDFSMSKSEYL